MLWNLALDERHGPHAGGCSDCRGVVTINSKTGAITRNVEYYVLAHASRFVRPGAHRIKSNTDIKGLETVAFQNVDDNSIALIVLNGANASRDFSVRHAGQVVEPDTTAWRGRDFRLEAGTLVAGPAKRRQRSTVRAPVTVCHAESAMDQ